MSSPWDHRFLDLAAHISRWSPDPSTKVGCVIVGPHREIRSTGYNGLPPGFNDSSVIIGPDKYLYMAHAEANSVHFAALNGVSLHGCTAYCTHPTCADCARALVRSGIKTVVVRNVPLKPHWADSVRAARHIFERCGITLSEL